MRLAHWLLATLLLFGLAGCALESRSDFKGTIRGNIQGRVKEIGPNYVLVLKDPERIEVRLMVTEATQKGEFNEGDYVRAFVTPGGTTTSIQPWQPAD